MLVRPEKRPRALKSVIRMLGHARAPSVLGLIVTYLMLSMPLDSYAEEKHASLEIFAGDRQYTDAWKADGFDAYAIDKCYDSPGECMNDINSSLGFLHCLHKTLQTNLVTLMAPVCSTWVNLNSGTSGRSLGRPLGKGSDRNLEANKMVSRVLLLCWLCAALGVCFIIEQPSGSWMEKHPRFQEFVKEHGLKRQYIEMKDFLVYPG